MDEKLHSWTLRPKEAIAIQKRLRRRVVTSLTLSQPRYVAGVDVAYIRETNESVATVAVISLPDLELVESATAQVGTPFPYVPGLLSFREIPPILQAYKSISVPIDLIFVDGHGQAHPRRIGIASHLGLWLRKPTIGIGKSRLCGRFEEPGEEKGSQSDLMDKGELIGTVLRTRTGVRPVFVSVGYGIPLRQCVAWTLRVTPKYRLPEPIRVADRLAARNKPLRPALPD